MPCPYIIIFDGECGFCNASVDFIFRHDPKALFCFASLNSDVARSLIKKQGLDEGDLDTLILIKAGKSYLRAEAVYEILKELEGPWSGLRLFRFLGKGCNEMLYRYIAKQRYRLFARSSCGLPSEELRSRFLTDAP